MLVIACKVIKVQPCYRTWCWRITVFTIYIFRIYHTSEQFFLHVLIGQLSGEQQVLFTSGQRGINKMASQRSNIIDISNNNNKKKKWPQSLIYLYLLYLSFKPKSCDSMHAAGFPLFILCFCCIIVRNKLNFGSADYSA